MGLKRFRWSIDGGSTWTEEYEEIPYTLSSVTDDDEVIVQPLGDPVTNIGIETYARSDGALPTLVFDPYRDFYWWGGERKTTANLTAQSTGFRTTDLSWLTAGDFSVVAEWIPPVSGAFTAGEFLFSLDYNGATRISLGLRPDAKGMPQIGLQYPAGSYELSASGVSQPHSIFGRNRLLASFAAGETVKNILNGMTELEAASTVTHATNTWTEAGFNYLELASTKTLFFSNPSSTTIVVYGSSMDEATRKATAALSFDDLPPICWLGDSISNDTLYSDGGGLVSQIKVKAQAGGYNAFATSIVGSTTMEDFATRYAAVPDYHGYNLVIAEIGLDVTGVDINGAIDDMLLDFTGDDYVVIGPIPFGTLVLGSSERIAWDAAYASMVSHVGADRVIPILEALQAANDGSANDLADVANGIVPRSLRRPADQIHLNAAGILVAAGVIYPALKARGWMR